MAAIPRERRMEITLEAFDKGPFPSKTACAKATDVAPRTLMSRKQGNSLGQGGGLV